MQGKGIIKFFLVVMVLVTAIQYLYVLPTNTVENNADEYAEQETGQTEGEVFRATRAKFLDSISDKTVLDVPLLGDFTYNQLKAKQLNLGLDLKGGMAAVLQVDLREFIRSLARNSKDPTLIEALDKASQAQQSDQAEYISLFADAWGDVAGGKRLAPLFAGSDVIGDGLGQNDDDGTVILKLRELADETVALTFEQLKRRIDKLGVVQPNISLDSERDLILVELPGIENPKRAREFLVGAAELEFFDVKRIDNAIFEAIIQADQVLERRQLLAQGRDSVQEKEFRYDTLYAADELGNLTSEIESIDTVEITGQTAGPLLSLLSLNGNGQFGEAVIGIAKAGDMRTIMNLMNDDEVARLFGRNVTFRWSESPLPANEDGTASDIHMLYQLNLPRGGKAPLTGAAVTDADSSPDPQSGQLSVNLTMNSEGARTWGRMTTEAYNDQERQVAIVLDSFVVSAPSVNSPILGGRTSITGGRQGFTVQEADDLASILQVGRLPARTSIVQESVVGPSLGADNINRSITAMLIGFGLVLVFMIFYYGGAGIVSIIALLLNLVFIFGTLASFGTVLTLPGVAGILLTIGMAVDANVIIYERVREELRAGKTKMNAIQDGFSASYSAIIDANVTTFLIAIVLAYFGLGPIKGFAVVLMVGVVSSVFTAVLVGRLMIDWWTNGDREISFWTPPSKNLFADVNIDWIGKRKATYAFSALLILGSLAAIFTRGFDLSVDFQGGYSYTVQLADDVDAQTLRDALTAPFDGNEPTIKAVDADNTYNIVTKYLVGQTGKVDGKEAQEVVLEALYTGVKAATGDNALTLEAFSSTELSDEGTHITQVSKVGPTIADDIKRSALWAGLIGLLLIFLYLLLRFNKWQYSLGAVAALFHDTIIVLGIFAGCWGLLGFNMEVDQAFIAAILTVIGYSINDTVVVFDRIREFLNTYVSRGKTEVINKAINSTVSRTVITSLTTLIVVLVLFLFGGSSIKGFAFALIVGILVGTYSSIFIATPIVHDLTEDLEAKTISEAEAVNA